MRDALCALGMLAVAVMMIVIQPGVAAAQGVAHIKVIKGTVTVERAGRAMPAVVGMPLQERDVVVTGPDGSVGITFQDDSLLSAGPSAAVAIDRFSFNPTTHAGQFETTLRSGTLAVVSGKIAKQSAEGMRVRTPSTVLGVRGTEFLVRAGRPAP
jgi:hypothetical protein